MINKKIYTNKIYNLLIKTILNGFIKKLNKTKQNTDG